MLKNIGIGIDIVNINRFRKISYSKKPSFYKSIFVSSELEYCLKFKNSYEHFAGKFAIKEAVKKSINEHVSLLEIETFHKDSRPNVKLTGKLKSKYFFLSSLSHDGDIAVAVVISQTKVWVK